MSSTKVRVGGGQRRLVLGAIFALVNVIVRAQSISTAEAALFCADVRGNGRSEIIVVHGKSLSIYSDSGEPLAEYPVPSERLIPVFTLDIDKDGKEEIVFGSVDAPQPRIEVINGMGRSVYRFIEEDLNATYSAFLPQQYREGLLYVICEPSWAWAPRGVMAVDLPSGRKAWMYCTPSVPVALRPVWMQGKPVFAVSVATRDNSTFVKYGKDQTFLAGSDKFVRLFAFDMEGETDSIVEIAIPPDLSSSDKSFRRDGRLVGTGQFFSFPGRRDAVLLHHLPDGAASAVAALYLIDSRTGRGIACFADSSCDVRAVVSGEGGVAEYVYAAARKDQESVVLRLDSSLRENRRAVYGAGATGTDSGNAFLRFFGELLLVRDGDSVAVFDGDLRELHRDQVDGLFAAVVVERPEGPTLVTLSSTLKLFDLSR